jgi:UDP-glucose 4-epimerase
MTWLVTGGAGYIGAHVIQEFLNEDIDVVAYDNLSTGRRNFIPSSVPFVHGDILDAKSLRETIRKHNVSGVIHLAGFKYANVSVKEPLRTYQQNVAGMITLLEQMKVHGVNNIVFSSSAAVYGTPSVDIVDESTPTSPESPYGKSKLFGEQLLDDLTRHGLKHTSLRYFNVIGSGNNDIYDVSPHNLLPLVFDALLTGESPQIFGDNYPTPDGTCVRDYIHVADLAKAHVSAAKRLQAGHPIHPVYNLGSGIGVSVKEIITTVAEVTGLPCEPKVMPRRIGDPVRIVADGTLAGENLGWKMRHSLKETVQSAWTARQTIEDTK